MRKKRAEAGIGTLILFIALILVAAVAAGVLIQTSSSLQSKALTTGSQAKNQVSAKVIILNAWAENASGDNQVDDIFFKMKLAPGSDPLVLNESYISFDSNSIRKTYIFNSSGTCNITNLSNTTVYGNNYMVVGRIGYSSTGYLMSGDVVDVCFRMPSALGQAQSITVAFVPKLGTSTSFKVSTPDVMTNTRVLLYP